MSLTGIKNSQLEIINMCQLYLRIIMISDLANISGNAITSGRMLGQWRKESKLDWPDILKPPPKAWEIFRRIMVKAFGTLNRFYNPCAEFPLISKLGKWYANERHSEHSIMRDRENIYVREESGWRQFLRSGKDGQYKESEKCISNIMHGHPCDGKIEGKWLYSHYKYNMCEIVNDQQQETQVLPTDIEIKAESEQTEIYSDGSVHSNVRKGACATIVSTGQRHYVQTLSLRGEQGKSSYRTELEGVYLGTKIAAEVDQGGTEWSYWTDSMSVIMQCGKKFI